MPRFPLPDPKLQPLFRALHPSTATGTMKASGALPLVNCLDVAQRFADEKDDPPAGRGGGQPFLGGGGLEASQLPPSQPRPPSSLHLEGFN